MNGQHFHQQKRMATKTEQCERSLKNPLPQLAESLTGFEEILVFINESPFIDLKPTVCCFCDFVFVWKIMSPTRIW